MAAIRVEGLGKSYGEVRAVTDVSLSVGTGEFVVLLGPSGSGKTTLLRCIAGLETPDSGEVFIGDEMVNSLSPRERDISMVFQNYALFPLMSVRDNIGFPLKVRGRPRQEIDEGVKSISQKLGISKLLDRAPRQLSGGEQQRVAIARTLIRRTNALLMDEPLSNLDAPLRAQLRTELKALQKEFGMTILYVTHDQVEAMTLAGKIGVMSSGRLLQYGLPLDVYGRPTSPFVAGFVGSPAANLIEVSLTRSGGSTNLDSPGLHVVLPPGLSAKVVSRPEGKYLFAIRPEDINPRNSQSAGTVECVVELVEPLGGSSILDLRVGSSMIRAVVDPSFKASVGDRVWMDVDFEKARLFDARTDELVL